LLGPYKAFPETIHGKAILRHNCPNKVLAKEVIQVMNELNAENLEIEKNPRSTPVNCTVRFEWGLSSGDGFVFLDVEETLRILSLLEKGAPPMLDFYFVILYHKLVGTQRTPLKFDYGFLRILFFGNHVEMAVSHEKGPMRLPIDELLHLLAERIDRRLINSRKGRLLSRKIWAV